MKFVCSLLTIGLFTITLISSNISLADSVSESLSNQPIDSAKLTESGNPRSLESASVDQTVQRVAEIQGSFSEDINPKNPKLDIDSSVFTQINAELKETVEDIILTLGVTTEESEAIVNASDDRYIVRAEPRSPGQVFPEEIPEPDVENTTDVTPPPRISPEDIPSFSEWSQQQLAERRRADPNVTERVRSTKHRIKNYASPDCGAKIVAANPEAVSAHAVLTSFKDDYMLNHCTSKVWFIVELCEAVLAKQIDLANFELFSSSPKEFSVFLGSRFPSRDWRQVGRFTAQDSRDVQTFELNPFLFGKYLKVEVHSHHGKEHYCPLSWVGVYGTSEYEVLATEDERHDDDDDVAEEEAGDVPRNLFSSATEAVLSIVKKATAPFMKTETRLDAAPATPSLCFSLRHLVVCDNCSQHMDDNLYYLLSCRHNDVYHMVTLPFVRRTLVMTDMCRKFGLDFVSLREGAPFPKLDGEETENYLTALLKEPFVAALCNALAVIESRVVVNTSMSVPSINRTEEALDAPPGLSILTPSSTCLAPDYFTSTPSPAPKDFSHSIQPTKTLKEDEVKVRLKPVEDSRVIEHTEPTSVPTKVVVTPSTTPSSVEQSVVMEDDQPAKVSFVGKGYEEEREPDSTLDAILQDLSALEQAVNSQPASATPPPSPPKDSIFLRLANRIKNLELNMSLSSSYLEELSRRYRFQFESLGQTVNATSNRLEEQGRMEDLRSRRREEEMAALKLQLLQLTQDVSLLLQERNSWIPRPVHLLWFVLELFVVWYFATRWAVLVPPPPKDVPSGRRSPKPPKACRRNSVDATTGRLAPSRLVERRPSDEALEITLTTNYSASDRRRKKRKKEGSRKSSAVVLKRQKSNSSDENPKIVVSPVRQASEPPLPTQPLEVHEIVLPMEIATTNRFAAFESPGPTTSAPSQTKLVRRLSAPGFMRTAISARATRSVPNDLANRQKKESGLKKYMRKFF